MVNKTKIVCTLGPASNDYDIMKKMLLYGMNVARLNCSYGDRERHRRSIELFRGVRDDLGIPAGIIIDIKGPEIRIGDFENGKTELLQGQTFTLTTDPCLGNSEKVSVTYANLPNEVVIGDLIRIGGGLIELEVKEIDATDIKCVVNTGGYIISNKRINIPGVSLDMDYLSEQDKEDILFGIEMDVDFVAASFVRSMDDVKTLRIFLNQNEGNGIKIISKIENLDAIEDFDSILAVSDGIMVSRGYMGVEVDFEKLPGLQKKIINKCRHAGKPVITATQMLESMTENLTPTRAEISDVANAIFDGTSAVMLSGESAVGKYPAEAVRTMSKIITQAEIDLKDIDTRMELEFNTDFSDFSNAIGHAACTTAVDINAEAIIAITKSGYTAEKISKYRPQTKIIAASTLEKTYHQQTLTRGVYPLLVNQTDDLDKLINDSTAKLIRKEMIKRGDPIVISAGLPIETAGTTNMIRVKKA